MATEALFLAVVLGVAGMFTYAVLEMRHGRGRLDRGRFAVLTIVLVGWLLVPAVLAGRGALDRYAPLPAPAFVLIGVLTLGTVVGLALLVNIVTIAVVSTPAPFRYFMSDPPNLLPSTFPYVWLPSFLVQAALFGHLLVFRAISRRDADRSGSVAARSNL
jgi:hypothetical protein